MKFLHMRYHDYMRVKGEDVVVISPCGGVSVAFEENGDNIIFSVAQCNQLDNFNYKIGRDICQGRFVKGYVNTVEKYQGEKTRDAIYRSIYEMLDKAGVVDSKVFLY